jgi:hypothetical protein
MGHMSEAVIAANLLSALTQQASSAAWVEMSDQLRRTAVRVGQNRVVAGVHYPIDLAGGLAVGQWIGQYLRAKAVEDGSVSMPVQEFDAQKFSNSPISANNWSEILTDVKTGENQVEKIDVTQSPFLHAVMKQARAEWDWLDHPDPTLPKL